MPKIVRAKEQSTSGQSILTLRSAILALISQLPDRLRVQIVADDGGGDARGACSVAAELNEHDHDDFCVLRRRDAGEPGVVLLFPIDKRSALGGARLPS